ncbi:MAG: PKD domain-containing protein [Armatimonadota bacterium]
MRAANKRGILLCVCLALPLVTGVARVASAAPIAWVAPSLVRVRPSDAAGAATALDLYAAKGETESLQVIVQAPPGGLTNVNVVATPTGGTTATLYREHYVYISPGTTDWYTNRNRPEGPGWYPDGLIPFIDPATGEPPVGGILKAAPFDLAEGSNQPIWVDLYVPRTVAAGVHPCTFTITSDQGETSVTANLHVWRFTLPLKPALKSYFRMEYEEDLPAKRLELLRNRLMPPRVEVSEERSAIDNLGLNCTNLGFWSAAEVRTGFMRSPPPLEDVVAAIATHQPDLYLYNYTADEIYITGSTMFFDLMLQWSQVLHQAGMDNLVVMPPVRDLRDDGTGTGRSAVDIWVLLPKVYDVFVYDVYEALAKGDRCWSYNALVQDNYSPKWQIDFAPINYRIQPGFINQSLNLTGLLYWAIDRFTADTWNSPIGGYSDHYPGEGLLVYPGAEAGIQGVAPSMRLKYLRDGVDDYDYIQLLKNRGYGDWALGIARSVGPDWANWTRDPNVLEAARLQLGNMLDSLPDAPPPTADLSASPETGPVPLTVQFTDQSADYPAYWHWTFGDGSTSFEQHPVHSYAAEGSYTVTLTVANDAGSDTVTREAFITATAPPPPVAFEAAPTLGQAPLTVEFADQSPGEPFAWHWQFGDGATSTQQHPIHEYQTPGAYSVSLTMTNPQGTGSQTKEQYVWVAFPDAPVTPEPAFWAARYIMLCAGANIVHGYEDGLYHPEVPITRDQMAVYIARALLRPDGDAAVPEPQTAPSFSDVPTDHWAHKQIEYAVSQNVVKGYEDGTYRPDAVVDRGQMAVFIARAMVAPRGDAGIIDAGPEATFPDVPGENGEWDWCWKHVEYLYLRYVITGYLDGRYHPEFAVTRDLMSAYVSWAFELGW